MVGNTLSSWDYKEVFYYHNYEEKQPASSCFFDVSIGRPMFAGDQGSLRIQYYPCYKYSIIIW